MGKIELGLRQANRFAFPAFLAVLGAQAVLLAAGAGKTVLHVAVGISFVLALPTLLLAFIHFSALCRGAAGPPQDIPDDWR